MLEEFFIYHNVLLQLLFKDYPITDYSQPVSRYAQLVYLDIAVSCQFLPGKMRNDNTDAHRAIPDKLCKAGNV